MKIVDLEEKYNQLYFMCLDDWSDEMREAGDKIGVDAEGVVEDILDMIYDELDITISGIS